MAYEQWILGFLSGIGSTGSSYGLNPLNGITDANAVWGWMDNYCREHPLDNIAAAGEAFLKAHPN
jgi:hypothetical protein